MRWAWIGNLVLGNNTLLKSSSAADFTVSRPLLLAGNVSLGEAATRTGTLTFDNTVDLGGATRTIFVSNPVTKWVEFQAALVNGGLNKAGPGLMILSAENTYAGGTDRQRRHAGRQHGHPDGRHLQQRHGGVPAERDGTYAGNMSGNGSVTKDGLGTLTISGNNTYDGITMINEGTLVISGSSARSAHVVGYGGRTDRLRHRRRPD
jgi:fibronectin-binding autotransporter adhesin